MPRRIKGNFSYRLVSHSSSCQLLTFTVRVLVPFPAEPFLGLLLREALSRGEPFPVRLRQGLLFLVVSFQEELFPVV